MTTTRMMMAITDAECCCYCGQYFQSNQLSWSLAKTGISQPNIPMRESLLPSVWWWWWWWWWWGGGGSDATVTLDALVFLIFT
jgi:hypothetical protein